jgi:hypothetical protein
MTAPITSTSNNANKAHMHLAREARQPPHECYRGVEHQPVDNMTLRMVSPDGCAKMLGDGLHAVLARRRLEDGLEYDSHRI